ncbi:MAG: hypothetical protein QOG63_2020, partial [Thermoleophilaceae bacterium]|nr:hypothetical protein [Thermoleophilaceae bacterium]
MSETLELAQRALAAAGGGADALAHVAHERSLMLRFARSRPTQATAVDDLTVTLAIVRDGHVGTASTNATGADDLAGCVRRATAAAEAAARSGGAGHYPGFPDGGPARPHEGFDLATARLDPRMGGAQLEAAFAECAERGVEAHGTWTAGDVATAVASGAGAAAGDRVTDAFMKVTAIAPGGRSGYVERTATASGDLDGSAIARAAAEKAALPGEPVRLEPGEYPVVLEADAVGDLVAWLGYLAVNGLAYAEG